MRASPAANAGVARRCEAVFAALLEWDGVDPDACEYNGVQLIAKLMANRERDDPPNPFVARLALRADPARCTQAIWPDGVSTLAVAALTDHAEAFAILADRADLNARDEEGQTVLMRAADGAPPQYINALLERGADASVRDPEGRTALMHFAARAGFWCGKWLGDAEEGRLELSALEALLACSDAHAVDARGRTALMRAALMMRSPLAYELGLRGGGDRLDLAGKSALLLALTDGAEEWDRPLRGNQEEWLRETVKCLLPSASAQIDPALEVAVEEQWWSIASLLAPRASEKAARAAAAKAPKGALPRRRPRPRTVAKA
jgi:hypothetical protein